MFILERTNKEFDNLLDVKKYFGDRAYVVTNINNFMFGFNPHFEIYGK